MLVADAMGVWLGVGDTTEACSAGCAVAVGIGVGMVGAKRCRGDSGLWVCCDQNKRISFVNLHRLCLGLVLASR